LEGPGPVQQDVYLSGNPARRLRFREAQGALPIADPAPLYGMQLSRDQALQIEVHSLTFDQFGDRSRLSVVVDYELPMS
jgi:hypothetical protein